MSETQPVRRGEEIDIVALQNYLGERLVFDDLSVEQFGGGASNLTYLIKTQNDEYVLRRPPFGNTVKSAHDMSREYRVLEKVSAVYPPAPRPVLFCGDASVIGSEFYLMERKQGVILRSVMPENSTASPHDICRGFIENLARLHSLDPRGVGLEDLGNPVGYARRQVEGWTKRYFNAKTDVWPEVEKVIGWLSERIPETNDACLIHNDYKFDNVILNPDDLTEVTGVLDWEMAAIGCPLMDLGTTLGYWMSPEFGEEMLNMPFNPRRLMENVSRKDLAAMYGDLTGRDVSNILFYYVFGTFKIAVIAQQIYSRYVKGLTGDQRFAKFNRFVSALGRIGLSAAESGRL